ncbi:hypothetical protein [Paraburkholderia adhaesiva]|uniref:hypothetical protein n=1 Tax=Paraburkholderia adhaesiva TaxID=2883244 RepID=UPI001F1B6509|nr:hypothetical protein [Paraburkholderia adhaesiva]
MSSHQCCLRGSLNIKADATDSALANALAPFLEAWGLDFDKELISGAIEILDDRHQLNLSLEFEGRGGGYVNIEIEETVGRLGHLVEGHGYVEMIDYDTAATENMITPFFVGAELRERNRARIQYAIDQATPWLESALDATAVHQIREHTASFTPLAEPVVSHPAGSPRAPEPKVPDEDALTNATGLTLEQLNLMATEAGLPGTVLDDIYNPEGDGEHPVITRVMWRKAVARQDTVSGYWDWTAHQIAEATAPALR